MRNPIIKGTLLVALAYLPALGCGGGNTEESNGVDDGKGGNGGAAASNGRGGTGGTIIIGGGTTGNGGGSSGTTGNGGSGGGCIEDQRRGAKATVALYFMVDMGSTNGVEYNGPTLVFGRSTDTKVQKLRLHIDLRPDGTDHAAER